MPERRHNRPFPITEAERIRRQKIKEQREEEKRKEYTDGLF